MLTTDGNGNNSVTGTANAYVYALDPINFSDFSGRCVLQCTISGNVLQPAATVTVFQATISATRIVSAARIVIQNISSFTAMASAAKPAVPRAGIVPNGTFDFMGLKAESGLSTAPTAGSSPGGGLWGGVRSVFGSAAHVGAAAVGGCASNAGAFSLGAVVATGGAVAVTGEGFLAAVGGSCIYGAIAGSVGYYIGSGADTPNSMMGDFRDGMSYGFYH